MFEIRRYTPDCADEWNQFVAESKNGTFLFDRRYMDYHQDRFRDHSLMFYQDGRLLAVLPAHVDGDTLYTHRGLTYGGLVMSPRLTIVETLALFRELNAMLRSEGLKHVIYKAVPWIYHRLSAEEDLYALYHECHARIVARDYSTNIFLGTKYGIRPVHTLAEIELLHGRFPDNIVLYQAVRDGQVLGGVVLYLSPPVVHAQYSSATPEGKSLGAIDAIYERIMHHDYKDWPYFDFGRSTENPDGSGLNEALVFQKEGFGARGLCYDIYEWDL